MPTSHERFSVLLPSASWLSGLKLDLGEITPAESRAWDEYRIASMATAFPRFGLVFAMAALVWWPTDWVTFGDFPRGREAMGWLRMGAMAATLLMVALFRWWPAARRYPQRIGWAFATPQCALAGFCMSYAGGPDGAWPHFLYLLSFVSFVLLEPLAMRVVATAMISIVTFGVYIATNPAYLADPMMPSVFSFSVFSAVLAVVIGHATYFLMQTSFLRGLRLRELNDQLEGRVLAQTSELRALANRIETLREEERSWMAREIHDELGQELSALRFGTEYARGRVKVSPEAGARAIEELESLLGRTSETVRRIIRHLRPRVLDEVGPVAAIEWLAQELASRGGLELRLSLTTDRVDLDGDRGTGLFRAAQELLTNVAKHARASWVGVTLTASAENVTLVVESDGQSLPDKATSLGSGITGIRERISALGGTARWQNQDGGGVRATIVLPRGAT